MCWVKSLVIFQTWDNGRLSSRREDTGVERDTGMLSLSGVKFTTRINCRFVLVSYSSSASTIVCSFSTSKWFPFTPSYSRSITLSTSILLVIMILIVIFIVILTVIMAMIRSVWTEQRPVPPSPRNWWADWKWFSQRPAGRRQRRSSTRLAYLMAAYSSLPVKLNIEVCSLHGLLVFWSPGLLLHWY